eukprot:GGOE01000957.1.p1 GENE.GGOE01000957.1~~GGOE01000957.1.p1  ORF type:complete len:594 (+),score=201.66 GGOE01000957.1:72-1853(+)
MQSLHDRQVAAISHLLRADAEPGALKWKILVYDPFCRDIIAPLLRVGPLRRLGVTLHLLLLGDRQPVREAPAVYFLRPTEENVRRFCADCKAEMYQAFFLNFVSPVARPLLELMAQELVGLRTLGQIKVFDQFLNYLALEHDLFTLQLHESYRILHSPPTLVSDQDAEQFVCDIVSGLAAVMLQMQVVPVVMSVRGGPAQAVAEKVTLQLADLFREKRIQPAPTASTPALVIFDRHHDLASCLAHPWTYCAMLHDVLDMKANKVSLPEDEAGVAKVFELDVTDQFWLANAGEPYPVVADRASEALDHYKAQKDRVTQHSAPDGPLDSITELVCSVPQMKEQKRVVDMHTTLAFALLNHVKARSLDAFHHVEMALIRGSGWDRERLQQLLGGAGTPRDRLRLFLLYYLALQGEGDAALAEIAKWERELAAAGVPLEAFRFLKGVGQLAAAADTKERPARGWLPTSLRSPFQIDLKDQLQKARTQLESTFKQKGTMLPLTRLIDAVLQDPTSSGKRALSGLCAWDPRTGNKIDACGLRFSHAIAFAVGGGGYLEHQNLKDWERAQSPRRTVWYGCTELVTPGELLQQLSALGLQT